MPYLTPATPFFEQMVTGFSSAAGSQTGGVKSYLIAPFRGKVLEVGFLPTSLSSAVAWTMAVAIGTQGVIDSTGTVHVSSFSQIVTSTLGTFVSQSTLEGDICSVVPTGATFVNRGDAIQFTHSGGATSAIGAMVYALLRRA